MQKIKPFQASRLAIVDSTLREGQQSLHPRFPDRGIVFSEAQQLELAALLIEFGVDHIEIFAPVRSPSAARIARQVIALARSTSTRVLVHTRVTAEDVQAALDLDVDGINLFINLSPFGKFSQGGEAQARVEAVLGQLGSHQGRRQVIRLSLEDAFRTSPKTILGLLQVFSGAINRVGLPDTTGLAYPAEVARLVKAVKKAYPGLEVECHFHNDIGLAVANAIYALASGATLLDTTLLGIGERTGIVPLSGLLAALCKTPQVYEVLRQKYRLEMLPRLDQCAAEMLGIPVPFQMPVSAPGAFAHVSGVHVRGHAYNPAAYQRLSPAWFGCEPRICRASAVVGKSALLQRAAELGLVLTEPNAQLLADAVREQAREKGEISPQEVDDLIRGWTSPRPGDEC